MTHISLCFQPATIFPAAGQYHAGQNLSSGKAAIPAEKKSLCLAKVKATVRKNVIAFNLPNDRGCV